MNVLGELVARERRSDRPAFRLDGAESYSYHDLCTTAWKAGNVLRHYGVAAGRHVEVAAVAHPAPVLTFLGAASIGAVTRFGPRPASDARAVLVPTAAEDDHELTPGSKLFVYGDRPERPGTIHWETDVWSENPAIPPYDVSPDDPVLVAGDDETTLSHRETLDRAEFIVGDFGLDAETQVAVRGTLERPGTVVAGLVAPLLAGGTIVAGDDPEPADVAVVGSTEETAGVPESVVVVGADVFDG
ncbi:acetyl-CoA synthetase [Halobium salinum]|uniref:Acetyl-CoA synthetase n=1 Tax=Halobium salinum TaxID=1364940 RepID=A0ABD5P7B6_9EURY|nr:acetyl-CoA synthetase [Halobium salinum]